MKTCTYCGKESEDVVNYCLGCGTEFSLPDDSNQRSRSLFRTLRLTRRKVRLILMTAIVTSVIWAVPWRRWLLPDKFPPSSMAGYQSGYFVAGEYAPTIQFASGDTATIYYASSYWRPT